jgi:membrane protease YdiL (CAAX protease family)
MQIVDHIFILLLFVVQPVYGVFESRRYDAREKAGRSLDRIRFYRQTAVMEWVFVAVLAVAWLIYSRPAADLGFVSPAGTGFGIGLLFVVVFTAYLLYSWRAMVTANDTEKARHRESLGKTVKYLPHTRDELRSFIGVSITAGIVEEIVYRGFVLWYLGHFMPAWYAVALSSVAFGLAHSYQGASGAFRCGVIGFVLGSLYVASGSIWLPIVAHVLTDALQGFAIHEILRSGKTTLNPRPATDSDQQTA